MWIFESIIGHIQTELQILPVYMSYLTKSSAIDRYFHGKKHARICFVKKYIALLITQLKVTWNIMQTSKVLCMGKIINCAILHPEESNDRIHVETETRIRQNTRLVDRQVEFRLKTLKIE